jgi:hypothetical protein
MQLRVERTRSRAVVGPRASVCRQFVLISRQPHPFFHPVNPVNPVKIQFFNRIVPV